MTTDPISDPSRRYSPAGLNRYVYCYNRPLYYTDPEGRWYLDLGIIGIGNDDTTGNFIFGVGFGLSNFVWQQDSSGNISNYQTFVGLNIANQKLGIGYSYDEKALYDEEELSFGIQYYCFNANISFYHKKTWNSKEEWWSVSGSAGISYEGIGVGAEAGISSYTNSQGQTKKTSDMGVYAGYNENGVLVGVNAQWNYDTYGMYTGMNLGVSIGSTFDGGNGELSFGTNAYFDAQGRFIGITGSVSIQHSISAYGVNIGSGSFGLTFGNVNGGWVLGGGINLNPGVNLDNMANAEAAKMPYSTRQTLISAGVTLPEYGIGSPNGANLPGFNDWLMLQPQEGQISTNVDTGQQYIYQNGEWVNYNKNLNNSGSIIEVSQTQTISLEENASKAYENLMEAVKSQDHDPDDIVGIMFLNKEKDVSGFGHNAIAFIYADGSVDIYSYRATNTDDFTILLGSNVPATMDKNHYEADDFSTFLSTQPPNDKSYNRYIMIPVDAESGQAMLNRAEDYHINAGTYNIVGHNCEHVAQDILSYGGLSFAPTKSDQNDVNIYLYGFPSAVYNYFISTGTIPNSAYNIGVNVANFEGWNFGYIGVPK